MKPTLDLYKRFPRKPSPKPSEEFFHAYLMIYRLNGNNYEVLIAQKQVISYKAIANFKHCFQMKYWSEVKYKIIKGKQLLTSKGKVECTNIHTRFEGTILPGAGKFAFFGGSLEKDQTKELPEAAALREFKEEFGLENEQFNWDTLIPLLRVEHRTDWGGIYYSLNLDTCLELAELLDIKKATTWIDSYNTEMLDKIYNQENYKNKKENYPEMKKIEWKNCKDLVEHLKRPLDIAFIENQVKEYSNFFFILLGINNDEAMKVFCNHLVTYIVHEDIRSNFDAAKDLINNTLSKLSKEKSAMQSDALNAKINSNENNCCDFNNNECNDSDFYFKF